MNPSRTLLRIAKLDAMVDSERSDNRGARSAFMTHIGLSEADWPAYRATYEREMARYCAERREHNRFRRAS